MIVYGKCWIWTGRLHSSQGNPIIGKKQRPVHRAVYEELVGPLGGSDKLWRVCRNILCYNPAHMYKCNQAEVNRLSGLMRRAMPGETKTCIRCKQDQFADEFHWNSHRDGTKFRNGTCRTCVSTRRKELKKDPERKARHAWLQRKSMLWIKYQITPEDYDSLLLEQEGCCAICGKTPAEEVSLAVDHCHKTGKIRGLLCMICNTGLGKIEDHITGVVRYLEKYKV